MKFTSGWDFGQGVWEMWFFQAVEKNVIQCEGSVGAFQIRWNDNAEDTKETDERSF